MSYVDTSIIVLALDPLDPRSDNAKKRLEMNEYKIVSELVLAELSSVIARRKEMLNELGKELKADETKLAYAIVLYILRRFNLIYRPLSSLRPSFPSLGKVYKPILLAIELSTLLRLKTLDLMHIAYIKALKEEGEPISVLLTGDKDFKNAELQLMKNLKIKVELVS